MQPQQTLPQNQQAIPENNQAVSKNAETGNKPNPNSSQNILKIAEIRDGLVIMNDGSYRIVVFTKSINFDLMSNREREAVELSFQGFLNNLYFPIQIFIKSTKVDISKYLDKLTVKRDNHENLLMSMMMDDYINFIANITQAANIMDKKFYTIIPFHPEANLGGAKKKGLGLISSITGLWSGKSSSARITINEEDLNQAKIELKNRAQAVLGGLANVGVQGVTLNTKELIELYYDTYNPDTATYQNIGDNTAINTPIITKGQGQPPYNLERGL